MQTMGEQRVMVVRTGTANLASVLAGLARCGAVPELTDDAAAVRDAERVVLPGVGAFAAAMEQLRAKGLVEPLAARIRAGRPTLTVCLGLQLLCAASDESPGVAGLGVMPGHVGRFSGGVRVPQLGWNRVLPDAGCRLLQPGYAYFANSYRLLEPPPGWHVAIAQHGMPFVAAVERGAVLACQFHPELSGQWGMALMRRWLAMDAATHAGADTDGGTAVGADADADSDADAGAGAGIDAGAAPGAGKEGRAC